jgi:hypothetical protein
LESVNESHQVVVQEVLAHQVTQPAPNIVISFIRVHKVCATQVRVQEASSKTLFTVGFVIVYQERGVSAAHT